MNYTKILKIIEDDSKLSSFIQNISSGYLELSYIMNETLNILSDESPFYNLITDNNKRALCYMLSQYFTDCWTTYTENIDFRTLLNYGKIEIYKVEATNGLRYATVKEVAQGVKGLIAENIYPIGEEDYKRLCLLYWTFSGYSYYFKQAGYELEYNDKKVATSFYEMIQMSAYDIKDLIAWIADRDAFENVLKKLKKIHKNKGYKYATYEKDEIIEDITIKQLLYNANKVLPRKSNNERYRKGVYLVLKAKGNSYNLTPYEISTLRAIYDEYIHDKGNNKKEETNCDLKELCLSLLEARADGKIREDAFVFNIVDTLSKINYTRCSPKQYNILKDAYDRLNIKKEAKVEVISDVDVDITLESISDAIGTGLFEDDE